LFGNPAFISTSGGMFIGSRGSVGTVDQSTVTRLRMACWYPSTRGNLIS